MRKVISSLLVFAMGFTICGCGFATSETRGHGAVVNVSEFSRCETHQPDCNVDSGDLYIACDNEGRSLSSRVAGGDEEGESGLGKLIWCVIGGVFLLFSMIAGIPLAKTCHCLGDCAEYCCDD